MAPQSTLTAELDDEGDIAWLWRTDPGKTPKPVKDLTACLEELDGFVVLGTSKPEVRGWLRHQVRSTAVS